MEDATKPQSLFSVSVISALLLISNLALLTCEVITPKDTSYGSIENYFKQVTDYLDALQYKREIVLILGDRDGPRGSVSHCLRNVPPTNYTDQQQNAVNHTLFPSFDLDELSGALLVDLPDFGNSYEFETEVMTSFALKKIFDHAEGLKVLLVVPATNTSSTEVKARISLLLSKLVKILDQNYNAFSQSIGLIGTTEMQNEIKYSKSINTLVSRFLHESMLARFFEIADIKRTYHKNDEPMSVSTSRKALLMEDVSHRNAYGVFVRLGSKVSSCTEQSQNNLQRFVMYKLSYATPVEKEHYQVVVDKNTKDIVAADPELHYNSSLVQMLSERIVNAAFLSDFMRGHLQHILHFKPIVIPRWNITDFYNEYAAKIRAMNDKQFGHYLFRADIKAEKRWHRFRLEREKTMFFEKLLGLPSSVDNIHARNLLLKQIIMLRDQTADMFSLIDKDDEQ